ncbi:heme peroxidase family protein [Leifsonia sp. NPDC080035]|uniref:Heme peroxidase family protein n=1 Tax=Leifsonia sp. NPDC080035 TaxID=3143936 RepID=A0AAU7GGP6_9MICO
MSTTTPTGAREHGGPQPRGLESTPESSFDGGRYGRMFRDLPTYDVADGSLVDLGKAMIQPPEPAKELGVPDEDENTAKLGGELRLPAGYTYFGQFIDHDITFDPASSLTRQNDPNAIVNFRTPKFDLDSLYGRGPSDQPYLYSDGIHLALGQSVSDSLGGPDLPRAANGRAIIGDPRNDENVIVSQLQSVFLRFHNAVVDRVAAEFPGWSAADHLKHAQRLVRWHYQWAVVHDYLPRLVGADVVADILPDEGYLTSPATHVSQQRPKLRFYHYRKSPFMPLEFSVAAYRFGHSIVRPSYFINGTARPDPAIDGAQRIPIFTPDMSHDRGGLNGFKTLPAFWGVDWTFLLPRITGSDPADATLPQPSYKLDAEIATPLRALPASVAAPELVTPAGGADLAQSLAIRNLLRGKRLGLPSGEDVSRAMGIEPLTPTQVFDGVHLAETTVDDLSGRTPLWYYILKESEVRAAGECLGPVGGRIVAEVLIGLLAGDHLSYLSVEPNWRPSLGPVEGEFTLSDVVNLALTVG